MNKLKILIQVIVILALIGYLACSAYMIYLAFDLLDAEGKLPDDYAEQLNSALIYTTSVLTGLVGGIVASGFGVEKPDNPTLLGNVKPKAMRLQNLGSYALTTNNSDKNKENMGFLYALSYIIVGAVAVVVWIYLSENVIQSIANMATTFLGMMVPITAQFFKK